MYRHLKISTAAIAAFAVSTTAAMAQSTSGWWSSVWSWYYGGGSTGGSSGGSSGGASYSSVPEIDASTGLLALAAMGAAIVLVWGTSSPPTRLITTPS